MLISHTRETTYDPTPQDVLWLRRAVEAEGEPRELVAQTLVNGFLWAREALGSKRTLADWVRAYAQPVNPRWMPGGDLHEHELAHAASEAERSASRARALKRARDHATRNVFTVATMRAVQRALEGPPQLPNATDYAAPTLVRPPPWVPLTPPTPGRNRFWMRPGAAGWQGYLTSLQHGMQQSGIGWLALGAVIAYWLWRAKG
jgi:hypothetical protein